MITSYDVVARDLETSSASPGTGCILDEAQDAKNPATKRHRALRRIPRRRALALTGTPIENSLGELWAIMDLVNPGLLGSRQAFERTFARPIEAGRDARALERLRRARRPVPAAPGQGRPRGRAGAAADHDREAAVPAHGGAGEPLPGDRRSLDAADRGARAPVRPARRRARDARAAQAGVQSPGARPPVRPPARRPLGKARAARRAPRGRARTTTRSLVFTQYPGFGRLAPHLAERLGVEVGFFHGGLTARARDDLVARFESRNRARDPRHLAPRGRTRAEPPGREPRLPLRPLVEPRRRAAGNRPRPPLRAAQARLRHEPHLHRDGRGADRRAPRLEARARRAGRSRAAPTTGSAELDLDTIRAAVALAPEAIEEAA